MRSPSRIELVLKLAVFGCVYHWPQRSADTAVTQQKFYDLPHSKPASENLVLPDGWTLTESRSTGATYYIDAVRHVDIVSSRHPLAAARSISSGATAKLMIDNAIPRTEKLPTSCPARQLLLSITTQRLQHPATMHCRPGGSWENARMEKIASSTP